MTESTSKRGRPRTRTGEPNRMAARNVDPATWAEVRDYCRRHKVPVGQFISEALRARLAWAKSFPTT